MQEVVGSSPIGSTSQSPQVEGVDIGIISKQLGHRSIATTARYLDHIAPEQLIETIRQRNRRPLVFATP